MSTTSHSFPAPADVASWEALRAQLDETKDAEMSLRQQIAAQAFLNPTKGTNTATFTDGTHVKCVFGFNRSIDLALLQNTGQQMHAQGVPLDRLVKWTPTVVESEYEALAPELRAIFDSVVTSTPSAPQLTVIRPPLAGTAAPVPVTGPVAFAPPAWGAPAGLAGPASPSQSAPVAPASVAPPAAATPPAAAGDAPKKRGRPKKNPDAAPAQAPAAAPAQAAAQSSPPWAGVPAPQPVPAMPVSPMPVSLEDPRAAKIGDYYRDGTGAWWHFNASAEWQQVPQEQLATHYAAVCAARAPAPTAPPAPVAPAAPQPPAELPMPEHAGDPAKCVKGDYVRDDSGSWWYCKKKGEWDQIGSDETIVRQHFAKHGK